MPRNVMDVIQHTHLEVVVLEKLHGVRNNADVLEVERLNHACDGTCREAHGRHLLQKKLQTCRHIQQSRHGVMCGSKGPDLARRLREHRM